jgi:hypothetical protein
MLIVLFMLLKLVRIFLCLAGLLLLVAAAAKVISASGEARILKNPDPILLVSFRDVFWIVGSIELIIAFICFYGKRVGLQVGLIASLSTCFLAYRLGLWFIGWQRPCPCLGLGNLTDALHIPPQTADTAMKIILAYLLIGSYGILFHEWWKRESDGRMPKVEIKPERGAGI